MSAYYVQRNSDERERKEETVKVNFFTRDAIPFSDCSIHMLFTRWITQLDYHKRCWITKYELFCPRHGICLLRCCGNARQRSFGRCRQRALLGAVSICEAAGRRIVDMGVRRAAASALGAAVGAVSCSSAGCDAARWPTFAAAFCSARRSVAQPGIARALLCPVLCVCMGNHLKIPRLLSLLRQYYPLLSFVGEFTA